MNGFRHPINAHALVSAGFLAAAITEARDNQDWWIIAALLAFCAYWAVGAFNQYRHWKDTPNDR